LPGAQGVLAQSGWSGLMEYVLGEAQFGCQMPAHPDSHEPVDFDGACVGTASRAC